jgi:hypothetical protein
LEKTPFHRMEAVVFGFFIQTTRSILMKKTIKSTAIMLITAIIAVFALAGCTNEPDNNKPAAIETAAKPAAAPEGGEVTDNTPITLSSETAGAEIYYTQDGTEPGTASALYSDTNKSRITTGKLTLKAIAVKDGMNNSAVLTAVYTIEPSAHTHQWGNWTETTAPTCTEAGIETRTCSLDATHTETRTGANALGHNFGDWTVTKEPTVTEEGEETRTCSRCGETEIHSIPKLTEVTLIYPPFVTVTSLNFNPTNLPDEITYILSDSITGSLGNTATGFNGNVEGILYSHGNVPIFTQIFNKDGKEVGRQVIGIRIMGGYFATLMDINGIYSLSDQTVFPSVTLRY